ncbi:MAG TPA: SLBB domain-containing protein [Chlamydiales bacterium]|nr:SLBB domain-containing protein [Chlamydiales bacterium]
MKKSLKSPEWILVISLLAILASIVLIAKINVHRAMIAISEADLKPSEMVAVLVEGAVRKPGIYQIIPGTPIQSVCKKAGLKRYADLKKIDLTARIEAPTHLVIQELSEIEVAIAGEVILPTQLRLPIGTRICDLKSKIQLTEQADSACFRSRRQLKDGEFFEIPKKTVE